MGARARERKFFRGQGWREAFCAETGKYILLLWGFYTYYDSFSIYQFWRETGVRGVTRRAGHALAEVTRVLGATSWVGAFICARYCAAVSGSPRTGPLPGGGFSCIILVFCIVLFILFVRRVGVNVSWRWRTKSRGF